VSTHSPPLDRAALVAGLDREMRRLTGQAVLLSQAIAERVGMHPTDLESLGLLFDEGPLTAGRLAELTGLSTGAVTRLVDRLERAGYVQRQRDPADRRRVIVRALPDAARDIAPLYADLGRAMADLCTRYSDADLALLRDFAVRASAHGREQTRRLREATTPSEIRPVADRDGARRS
jgi:DNA-binding MarR family transcriptional regulator